MRLAAELTHAAPIARRAERHPLSCPAKVRERGKTGVAVHVLDISISGCKIELDIDLPPGSYVWLKMPGLESWTAHVAWQRDRFAGCTFERQLHPAVVQRMTGRG